MTRTIILTSAVLLMVGVYAGPVLAHDWYDPECCNGQDCQVVKPDRVTATPDGWRVQIAPGDHVLSHTPIDVIVPYDDPKVRDSMDGDFHVCIGPTTNTLFCIYVPPFGA